MKIKILVLVILSSFWLGGCHNSDYYIEKGYDEGFFEGHDEGYDEGEAFGYDSGYCDGYDVGYDVGYEDGYEDGVYLENEQELSHYYSIMSLIDELQDFDILFKLSDDCGCYPSDLLGKYCFDYENNLIHETDSECMVKLDKSKICPCVLYGNYTKEDVSEEIKSNEYLRTKNLKFCDICMKGK